MGGFLLAPTFTQPVPPIPLGANGQVLTMVGGHPQFAAAGGPLVSALTADFGTFSGTLVPTPLSIASVPLGRYALTGYLWYETSAPQWQLLPVLQNANSNFFSSFAFIAGPISTGAPQPAYGLETAHRTDSTAALAFPPANTSAFGWLYLFGTVLVTDPGAGPFQLLVATTNPDELLISTGSWMSLAKLA